MTSMRNQATPMAQLKFAVCIGAALLTAAPLTAHGQARGSSVTVQNGPEKAVPVAQVPELFQEAKEIRLTGDVVANGSSIVDVVPKGKVGVIEFVSFFSSLPSGGPDPTREVFVSVLVKPAVGPPVGAVAFGEPSVGRRVGAAEKTFLVIEPGDTLSIRVNRGEGGFTESVLVTIAGQIYDDPEFTR